MLSCPHWLDDHRCVQHRRRTDIDNIDVRIGDQVAKASIRRCNLVLLGKIHNLIAPCGDGLDLGLDTVNAPVGVHMQVCDKPAPDQTDLHRRHVSSPSTINSLAATPDSCKAKRQRTLEDCLEPRPNPESSETSKEMR